MPSENTFLELLEVIDAERASVRSMFEGEGTSVRGVTRLRASDPAYQERLLRVVEMLAAYQRGRIRRGTVEEAMSTSDFPLLFGDIVDRTLLAGWREWPASYEAWCAMKTVNDFKTANLFSVNGAEGVLSAVAQGAEYAASSLSEAKDTISVGKYGRRLPFTWEAILDDDLGAFTGNIARLGRAARRTIAKAATQLYIDASGPHASLYTAGNANIINATNGAAATNPALSVSGLIDGLTVMSQLKDSDSEPIVYDLVTLVVPPTLEPTAAHILNATELRLNERGGVSNEQLIVANWLKTKFRYVVDPYIPIVATTNGRTSWALFGNPADGRPACMVGKLRGHEEPETFMKAPNAIRVGGAQAGALDGSFENDSIDYKVRLVFGTARIAAGAKTTVASNGSGA